MPGQTGGPLPSKNPSIASGVRVVRSGVMAVSYPYSLISKLSTGPSPFAPAPWHIWQFTSYRWAVELSVVLGGGG